MRLRSQAPAAESAGVLPALRPGRIYYDSDWGRWLVWIGEGHRRTATAEEVEAEESRERSKRDTMPGLNTAQGEATWPDQHA